MQLVKHLIVLSLFVGSVSFVYLQTKNSYLSRGVSDGELNAKIDIFNRLKPHIGQCHLGDLDSSQRLLKAKTLEIHIKSNRGLCYRE